MVKRATIKATGKFLGTGELPPFTDRLKREMGPSTPKQVEIAPFNEEIRGAIVRSVIADLGEMSAPADATLIETAAGLAIDKVIEFQVTGQIDTGGEI
jgi:hypothetical protein